MNYFWTYRHVPLPSPKSWAIALTSLAVYGAAMVRDVPWSATPLGFCVAVYFGLRILRSTLFFPETAARAPFDAGRWTIAAIVLNGALLLWVGTGPSGFAVGYWALAGLLVPVSILFLARREEARPRLPSSWASRRPESELALTLEATGLYLNVLTGIAIWAHFGDTAFAIYLTLGQHAVHFLINWIILLVMITPRDGERG
jgi:hypothetical protein